MAFKKFRYMVEAISGHLPGFKKNLLSEMHHYQTLMGEIQDAEVLLRAFQKFVRKKEISPGSAHQLQEQLLRRRQRLIREYLDAASELDNFWHSTSNARHRSSRLRAAG